jgi:hypothetical protein
VDPSFEAVPALLFCYLVVEREELCLGLVELDFPLVPLLAQLLVALLQPLGLLLQRGVAAHGAAELVAQLRNLSHKAAGGEGTCRFLQRKRE